MERGLSSEFPSSGEAAVKKTEQLLEENPKQKPKTVEYYQKRI